MRSTDNGRLVSGDLLSVERPPVTRRGMLRTGALAAALALPAGAMAVRTNIPDAYLRGSGEWRLAFRNVHTNERVDALFGRDGRYVAEGLAELDHGLRDWRTGESIAIDRRLLGLLVQLRDRLELGSGHAIDLISGYRSPNTNAALRDAGGAHSGVASQSQHMLGKASDIMVPGVTLDRLHGAALALGGGGVGYYPRDGFVHVDTGRVRHW